MRIFTIYKNIIRNPLHIFINTFMYLPYSRIYALPNRIDKFGPFTDLCWNMSRPANRQSVTFSTGRIAAIVFCPGDWWKVDKVEIVTWGYGKR